MFWKNGVAYYVAGECTPIGGIAPAPPPCGGGLFGAPPIVEQPPGNIKLILPGSATGTVGTKVTSTPGGGVQNNVKLAINPTTGRPIYSVPCSAGGSVGIVPLHEHYDPGPIPPVGIIPPTLVYSSCGDLPVAPPASKWRGL